MNIAISHPLVLETLRRKRAALEDIFQMRALKNIILMTCIATATTAFSRVIFAQAPPQINPNWTVDLRTVFAVGGIVLLATWRLAGWMRKVEDRQEQQQTALNRIERQSGNRDRMLRKLCTAMNIDHEEE